MAKKARVQVIGPIFLLVVAAGCSPSMTLPLPSPTAMLTPRDTKFTHP